MQAADILPDARREARELESHAEELKTSESTR